MQIYSNSNQRYSNHHFHQSIYSPKSSSTGTRIGQDAYYTQTGVHTRLMLPLPFPADTPPRQLCAHLCLQTHISPTLTPTLSTPKHNIFIRIRHRHTHSPKRTHCARFIRLYMAWQLPMCRHRRSDQGENPVHHSDTEGEDRRWGVRTHASVAR